MIIERVEKVERVERVESGWSRRGTDLL